MTDADLPLRPGDIVRIRGARWRLVQYLPAGPAAVIEVEGSDAANRAERGRFLLPFERIDRLPAQDVPRVVGAGRWRHVARQALSDAAPAWHALRSAARANLAVMPFQLEPALALIRGDGCRFLLADAVGLGKTVQAGLMIAETLARRPDARAIVVAPAGLREQWHDELTRRFGLDAAVLDAANVARIGVDLPVDVNPWTVHALVIASIDYVKRPEIIRCLEGFFWDVAVFDEAHALAGRSDRAAAAAALASRARAVVMLTATPHSGDEDAFGRLCRLGDLGGGHQLLMFRRTRGEAGLAAARRAVFLRVRPTFAEAAMHDALIAYARLVWSHASRDGTAGARLAVSVLARRAASSAAALARSVERRLALLTSNAPPGAAQLALPFPAAWGEDDEPGAVLGAPGLGDAGDECARLARLLELARTAARAESKVAALRRLVARTGEPAIVFTEYRDTLERLADALGHAGVVTLHGALTLRERAEALRRFADGQARLLLATDAASEGLNLHHRCRLVVNLELPWTPVRLEQRAGRVDRIGQLRRVHALHLVAAGTSEETVLARLARRAATIQRALGGIGELPTDHEIADSVLGGHRLPDVAAAVERAPVPGVAAADLRDDARHEAARITASRMWLDRRERFPKREMSLDGRPAMTRIRRRGTRGTPPSCFWLFTLSVTAADRRPVADVLLAARADATPSSARTRAATRELLDPRHPRLRQVVCLEGGRRLQALDAALRRPLDLWLRRERALMAAARDRRARLAAGLVQRALFDRRPDRLAAAQQSLLDETLLRSADRIAQLAACEDLRIDACDLVFALVLE